ncbi:uncharacterized protein [Henckelia pumila]|uniref:uncharacterized protein isoform X2 n=1 Tax=Henckelia pumila TaxID=405737 RepID=UPI003C6E08CF
MAHIEQQLQQKPESTTSNDSRSVFERNLAEFVLEHYDECMSFTSCNSPRTTVTEDEEGEEELLARRRRRRLDLDSDDRAESSAARRCHSRVLRMWAGRQAEMITTIERRNRESELMALAGLHTVSMLDASFLRESQSPTLRHQGNVDRPSTQASSILQMWRELEDEHALHHARERSRQRRSVESNANASVHALESGGGESQGRVGEASESGNDHAIWSQGHQLESLTVRNHGNSSREQSPDLGEVERERVRQIVHGWMESGINDLISNVMQRNESPRAERLDETERERAIVRVGMQMTSQQRVSRSGHGEEPNNQPGTLSDHALKGSVTDHEEILPEHIHRDILRLRGRQALLDLLVRFERERQRELQVLMEHRPVSDFAHRNRIQSLLRGRFLRNERPLEEESPPSVAANELNQLRQRHTVSGFREGFRSRLENIARVQVNSHSETPSDNDNSDFQYDHSIGNESREIRPENRNIDELVGILDSSTAVQSASQHVAPAQRSDQQGEVIEGERTVQQQSVHDSSNEWIYNTTEDTDQNQPENSVPNWPSETTVIEVEHRLQEVHVVWRDIGSQGAVDNWSEGPLNPPRMQRSVPNRRLTRFHLPDNDNVYSIELRELLNRRSVSNLLRSGFRESLDQLIQSYVVRQGRPPIDSDTQRNLPVPPSPGRDQDQQNDYQNEDHLHAVGRPSLILPTLPVLPTRPLRHQELHHSGWSRHSTHRSELESEMINDLRADMAKLQQGMNHMQRLLEACMDMQQELQCSVRQELSSALNRSTGGQGLADTSDDGSNWGQVRKGTRCICCDNQIDCLLYRCGHMCTCSTCANELIFGGGKCPLCRAPIVEVIRAYYIL